MTELRAFDHVGITVADLRSATAFFVGLGLEVEGRAVVEGEFLDTVCGLTNAKTQIVMMRSPGGGTAQELSSFVRPEPNPGSPTAVAYELGLRSVAFRISDLEAVVGRLAADGYGRRRHRSIRERLADGLRARSGRNHRRPRRTDRRTTIDDLMGPARRPSFGAAVIR